MSTQNHPFLYGVTVAKASFTDREADFEKLRSNLLQGINTIIISPRRWGKSSLVEKTVMEINRSEKNQKTVVIDLFSVNSKEEFLELFAKEIIKASSTKWEEWLKTATSLLKNIVPKISVGVDPQSDFSLSFDWQELSKHEDEILNLPETIAAAKKFKFVICLDEFQNLANFHDYESVEKKMRAVWQRQKRVTYCLFGSKRHMMDDIFNTSTKPFYRFGDLLYLQKIAREHWVSFITKGFKKSGKTISPELAGLIADHMKNHSWYVQQLAHYTWNRTKTECTASLIDHALDELIAANTPLYQREIEWLSSTQTNLLKAIAHGEKQLTSTAVMQRFRIGTPRNVAKNRDLLRRNDIVDESKDGFEFLDPAFEIWFRRNISG
ncbi:MAG: ATP-binding protein [Salibacteraceae bacterium]